MACSWSNALERCTQEATLVLQATLMLQATLQATLMLQATLQATLMLQATLQATLMLQATLQATLMLPLTLLDQQPHQALLASVCGQQQWCRRSIIVERLQLPVIRVQVHIGTLFDELLHDFWLLPHNGHLERCVHMRSPYFDRFVCVSTLLQ
jgi:hypothetical protein